MALSRSVQFASTAALALAVLACLSPTVEGGKQPLTAIKTDFLTDFDKEIATKEVDNDIDHFIEQYKDLRGDLRDIAEEFNESRVKDVGIRKIADWGISLSRVYEIGAASESQSGKLLQSMKECADLLLGTQATMHGYVENKQMRGWPMYVSENDGKPTFESFNFGHIGMAISLAARALATEGEHTAAAEMISPVLDALYDGFLTEDATRTKLDKFGRVVYVPREAPAGRVQRHLRVTEQSECLDNPQAYNHGLMAARAAIATWRAINEIDWTIAQWPMEELPQRKASLKLETLIMANARYLKSGLIKQRPTGASRFDKYPGPDGQTWYQWKYRDYSKCPEAQGTYLDRPEDIAHATYETNFVVEFRAWLKEHDRPAFRKRNSDIFAVEETHAMIVTFLNRIVADYNARGGKRFACDVHGTTDESPKGNHAWKQCSGSRRLEARAGFAPAWLSLAASLRREMASNDLVHCDALRMVKSVLPLTMKGDKEYDPDNFDSITVKYGSQAIEAKYYWHYFEKGMEIVCDRVARSKRIPGQQLK